MDFLKNKPATPAEKTNTDQVSNTELVVLETPVPSTETVQDLMKTPAVAQVIEEQVSIGALTGTEFATALKGALETLRANRKSNVEGIKKLFTLVCDIETAEQEVYDVLDQYAQMDGGVLRKGLKEMDEGINKIKPFIGDVKDAIEGSRNAVAEFFKSDARVLAASFEGIKGRITTISSAFKQVDENLDIVDEKILGKVIPNTGKRICMTEAMIVAVDKMLAQTNNVTRNELLEAAKTSLISVNASLKKGMEQLVFIQKNQLFTRLTHEATKWEVMTRLPVTIGVNVSLGFQAGVYEMGMKARASLDALEDGNQKLIDDMLNLKETQAVAKVAELEKIASGMEWLQTRIATSNERMSTGREMLKSFLPNFKLRVENSAKGIMELMEENERGSEGIKNLISEVESDISELKEKFPDQAAVK